MNKNREDFIKNKINPLSASEVKKHITNKDEDVLILDVRETNDYTINEKLNDLDKNSAYFIYHNNGYHSVIATSILQKNGFIKIINMGGGFSDILNSTIPLYEYRKNCATCAFS